MQFSAIFTTAAAFFAMTATANPVDMEKREVGEGYCYTDRPSLYPNGYCTGTMPSGQAFLGDCPSYHACTGQSYPNNWCSVSNAPGGQVVCK